MLCTVLVALVAALVAWDWWRRRHWHRVGLPTAPGHLPLLGHMLEDLNFTGLRWLACHEQYLKSKDAPLVGRYGPLGMKVYSVQSLELSQHIFIKDFDHFTDRRSFASEKFSEDMLNNLTGERWKKVRSLMSPAFTSGKLKVIFDFMENKSYNLIEYLKKHQEGEEFISIEKVITKYNIDTIGSTAFGLEMNLLQGDNAELAVAVETLFDVGFYKDVGKVNFIKAFPNLSKKLGVHSWYLDITAAVERMVGERLESDKQHEDFLDLMIQAKKNPDNTGVVTDTTVVASAALFLFAGFDTTSSTELLVLHALAGQDPKFQQRLREELRKIRQADGHLRYQDVMELPYLDAICNETMRIYPAGHAIERICTKDYQFPGTSIVVQKGDAVVVPVYSFHHDPEFFPEPEVFNPERFMPENRASIRPGTFMPFGIGPRMCIATRFAAMATKLTVAQLVLHFAVAYPEGHAGLKLSDQIGIIRPDPSCSRFVLTPV